MKEKLRKIYRKPIAPCKSCTDRLIGCHGTCERYGKYRKQIRDEKRRMNEAYMSDIIANNYTIKATLRMQKRKSPQA